MLIKFSIIFCKITYLSSFFKRERSCFSLQKCKKDNAKLLKIIFPSNALKSYISYIRFDRDRAAFIISKRRAKPADFAGVVIKLAPFWKSRDNATWRNSGLAGILSSQQIVGWPNPVITIRVGFAPFPPSLPSPFPSDRLDFASTARLLPISSLLLVYDTEPGPF